MTDLTPLRERIERDRGKWTLTDDEVVAIAADLWDRARDGQAQAIALNAPLASRAQTAETALARFKTAAREIVDL